MGQPERCGCSADIHEWPEKELLALIGMYKYALVSSRRVCEYRTINSEDGWVFLSFRAGLSFSVTFTCSPASGLAVSCPIRWTILGLFLLKIYRPGRPNPDICKWHGFDPLSQFVWDLKSSQDVGLSKCPNQGSPWQTELSWALYICVCVWKKDLKF